MFLIRKKKTNALYKRFVFVIHKKNIIISIKKKKKLKAAVFNIIYLFNKVQAYQVGYSQTN